MVPADRGYGEANTDADCHVPIQMQAGFADLAVGTAAAAAITSRKRLATTGR